MLTDEVKIEFCGCIEQRYVWRKMDAEFDEKDTPPTVKHCGESIMFWPCIAATGMGNISVVKGKNISIKYQQILKAKKKKKLNVKKWWILQQDNDDVHNSKSALDYLRMHKLKILLWPSQSHDLNINVTKEQCMPSGSGKISPKQELKNI